MTAQTRFSALSKLAPLILGSLLISCRSKPQKTSGEDTAPRDSAAQSSSGTPTDFLRAAEKLDVEYRGVTVTEASRVVVLFHGYGADKHDLADLSEVMDMGPKAAFVFPEAPHPLPIGGYAWFARDGSDFERGYQIARAFVYSVQRKAPQAGFIIGGFSQGAMISANLIATLPQEVEAVLLFSPGNLLPHAPVESTRKVPLFISHGRLDQVLPFSGARSLHDRFQGAGFDVTWQPFVGPHTISREVLVGLNAFLQNLPGP